ncbi:transmembrane protein, partial [Cystoisospora suis]
MKMTVALHSISFTGTLSLRLLSFFFFFYLNFFSILFLTLYETFSLFRTNTTLLPLSTSVSSSSSFLRLPFPSSPLHGGVFSVNSLEKYKEKRKDCLCNAFSRFDRDEEEKETRKNSPHNDRREGDSTGDTGGDTPTRRTYEDHNDDEVYRHLKQHRESEREEERTEISFELLDLAKQGDVGVSSFQAKGNPRFFSSFSLILPVTATPMLPRPSLHRGVTEDLLATNGSFLFSSSLSSSELPLVGNYHRKGRGGEHVEKTPTTTEEKEEEEEERRDEDRCMGPSFSTEVNHSLREEKERTKRLHPSSEDAHLDKTRGQEEEEEDFSSSSSPFFYLPPPLSIDIRPSSRGVHTATSLPRHLHGASPPPPDEENRTRNDTAQRPLPSSFSSSSLRLSPSPWGAFLKQYCGGGTTGGGGDGRRLRLLSHTSQRDKSHRKENGEFDTESEEEEDLSFSSRLLRFLRVKQVLRWLAPSTEFFRTSPFRLLRSNRHISRLLASLSRIYLSQQEKHREEFFSLRQQGKDEEEKEKTLREKDDDRERAGVPRDLLDQNRTSSSSLLPLHPTALASRPSSSPSRSSSLPSRSSSSSSFSSSFEKQEEDKVDDEGFSFEESISSSLPFAFHSSFLFSLSSCCLQYSLSIVFVLLVSLLLPLYLFFRHIILPLLSTNFQNLFHTSLLYLNKGDGGATHLTSFLDPPSPTRHRSHSYQKELHSSNLSPSPLAASDRSLHGLFSSYSPSCPSRLPSPHLPSSVSSPSFEQSSSSSSFSHPSTSSASSSSSSPLPCPSSSSSPSPLASSSSHSSPPPPPPPCFEVAAAEHYARLLLRCPSTLTSTTSSETMLKRCKLLLGASLFFFFLFLLSSYLSQYELKESLCYTAESFEIFIYGSSPHDSGADHHPYHRTHYQTSSHSSRQDSSSPSSFFILPLLHGPSEREGLKSVEGSFSSKKGGKREKKAYKEEEERKDEKGDSSLSSTSHTLDRIQAVAPSEGSPPASVSSTKKKEKMKKSVERKDDRLHAMHDKNGDYRRPHRRPIEEETSSAGMQEKLPAVLPHLDKGGVSFSQRQGEQGSKTSMEVRSEETKMRLSGRDKKDEEKEEENNYERKKKREKKGKERGGRHSSIFFGGVKSITQSLRDLGELYHTIEEETSPLFLDKEEEEDQALLHTKGDGERPHAAEGSCANDRASSPSLIGEGRKRDRFSTSCGEKESVDPDEKERRRKKENDQLKKKKEEKKEIFSPRILSEEIPRRTSTDRVMKPSSFLLPPSDYHDENRMQTEEKKKSVHSPSIGGEERKKKKEKEEERKSKEASRYPSHHEDRRDNEEEEGHDGDSLSPKKKRRQDLLEENRLSLLKALRAAEELHRRWGERQDVIAFYPGEEEKRRERDDNDDSSQDHLTDTTESKRIGGEGEKRKKKKGFASYRIRERFLSFLRRLKHICGRRVISCFFSSLEKGRRWREIMKSDEYHEDRGSSDIGNRERNPSLYRDSQVYIHRPMGGDDRHEDEEEGDLEKEKRSDLSKPVSPTHQAKVRHTHRRGQEREASETRYDREKEEDEDSCIRGDGDSSAREDQKRERKPFSPLPPPGRPFNREGRRERRRREDEEEEKEEKRQCDGADDPAGRDDRKKKVELSLDRNSREKTFDSRCVPSRGKASKHGRISSIEEVSMLSRDRESEDPLLLTGEGRERRGRGQSREERIRCHDSSQEEERIERRKRKGFTTEERDRHEKTPYLQRESNIEEEKENKRQSTEMVSRYEGKKRKDSRDDLVHYEEDIERSYPYPWRRRILPSVFSFPSKRGTLAESEEKDLGFLQCLEAEHRERQAFLLVKILRAMYKQHGRLSSFLLQEFHPTRLRDYQAKLQEGRRALYEDISQEQVPLLWGMLQWQFERFYAFLFSSSFYLQISILTLGGLLAALLTGILLLRYLWKASFHVSTECGLSQPSSSLQRQNEENRTRSLLLLSLHPGRPSQALQDASRASSSSSPLSHSQRKCPHSSRPPRWHVLLLSFLPTFFSFLGIFCCVGLLLLLLASIISLDFVLLQLPSSSSSLSIPPFARSREGLSTILAFNFTSPSSTLFRDSLSHCLQLPTSSSSSFSYIEDDDGTPSLSERSSRFPSLFKIDASLFSLVSPGSLASLKEQLGRRISSFSLGASHDGESVQTNVDAEEEEDEEEETVNRFSGREEVRRSKSHSRDDKEKREKERMKEEKIQKKKEDEEKRRIVEEEEDKDRDESLEGREKEEDRRTREEEEGSTSSSSSSSSPHDAEELPISSSETKKREEPERAPEQHYSSCQRPRQQDEASQSGDDDRKKKKKKMSRRVDFFTLWSTPFFPPIGQLRRSLHRALFADNVFSQQISLPSSYPSHLPIERGDEDISSSSSHEHQEGRRRKERKLRHLLPSFTLDTSPSLSSSSSSFLHESSPFSLSPSLFLPHSHPALDRLTRKEEEEEKRKKKKIFDRFIYDRLIEEAISSPDGGEKEVLRALGEMTRGKKTGDDGSEWFLFCGWPPYASTSLLYTSPSDGVNSEIPRLLQELTGDAWAFKGAALPPACANALYGPTDFTPEAFRDLGSLEKNEKERGENKKKRSDVWSHEKDSQGDLDISHEPSERSPSFLTRLFSKTKSYFLERRRRKRKNEIRDTHLWRRFSLADGFSGRDRNGGNGRDEAETQDRRKRSMIRQREIEEKEEEEKERLEWPHEDVSSSSFSSSSMWRRGGAVGSMPGRLESQGRRSWVEANLLDEESKEEEKGMTRDERRRRGEKMNSLLLSGQQKRWVGKEEEEEEESKKKRKNKNEEEEAEKNERINTPRRCFYISQELSDKAIIE